MPGRKTDYAKVREQDRRDKISITRCLNKLTDIEKELETNGDDLNVPALRLRADISMNLLKKRLPDLKAVDHTSDGQAVDFSKLVVELVSTGVKTSDS